MDLSPNDLPASEVNFIRLQVWIPEPNLFSMHLIGNYGTVIGRGTGRTLGRMLVATGMGMLDRDLVDFMDTVLAGRTS